MLTSDPAPSDRLARRTWWFVYTVWAIMVLQALVFVIIYPDPGPISDEWEFVPALTDEEPFWPWVWKLHNEHRFPLARLVYYPLFKLTGDFRAGCFLSVVGVSFCSLLMISTAARCAGRLHFTDAFFPLSLLHIGHWENWIMGYQIVFMMNLVLAAILFRIILLTNRANLQRRGIEAGLVTLLLLGCGAGGLAYGPFMALWLLALAFWFKSEPKIQHPKSKTPNPRWVLVLLAALVPIYIGIYLQGYQRPHQHADPLAVWGSLGAAAWQAVRSAMQALSMAFGPAATGLWPASAFIIGVTGIGCVLLLLWTLARRIDERPRVFGLLLDLGALAFMALGIGWGRSVFLTDDDQPGFMGLSSRYGWIVWQALGAVYFIGIIYGKGWLRWLPHAMFASVVVMLPFNIGTGIEMGEHARAFSIVWERSVRSGMTADELVEEYYKGYLDLPERVRVGVDLLRKSRVQYYQPVPQNGASGQRNGTSGAGHGRNQTEGAP